MKRENQPQTSSDVEKTESLSQEECSQEKYFLGKLGAALSQFIKFGVVGGLNTALSYLITNASYYGLHLHEQISNLISFLITVFISYLLNSRFVFRGREEDGQPWYKALAKVYASYALTELVLMGVLLFIQERLLGIPHFIATLINLCVTVPLNFVLNKFWAYRESGSKGSRILGRHQWIYVIFTGTAIVCGLIWSCTNLGYDGEYQIAMSYRLLQGDKMFLEMWEPHQTSALLPAGLMWIYRNLFHTTTGVAVYLQICGILIRGAIAALLYRLLCADVDRSLAYGAALLYFMIAPKDYALPEFSNLQLWFSTLLFCCLWAYLRRDESKRGLLILGAVFLCLEVLAYPSCAIVLPGVVGLLAFGGSRGQRWKDGLLFAGTCAALGVAVICRFLFTIGWDELMACIAGMLALEPTHTVGMFEKLCGYGRDLLESGIVLAAAGVIGWGIRPVLQKIIRPEPASGESEKKRLKCWMWLLCCAGVLLTGFFVNILSADRRYAYSVILLFITGVGLLSRKALDERERRLYICGTVIGGLGFLATLILTDLPLAASVPYGLLAVVSALIPMGKQVERISFEPIKKGFYGCFLCFVALLAFRCVCVRTPLSGKGQICSGFSDLSIVRVGPALGIISNEEGVCIQRDSYPEWREYIREGDKVWIVGGVVDTLGYLYEDVEVAAPSTMSTPFYSDAILEYWRLNPDKYPDVIVAESYMGEPAYELLANSWILPWIEEEYRPAYTVEGKFWTYYFREER